MRKYYFMIFISLFFLGCNDRQLEKINERNRDNIANKENIIAEKNAHIERLTARNYEQKKIMARERGNHERMMADKNHAHAEKVLKEHHEQERIMTDKENKHREIIEKEQTVRKLKLQTAAFLQEKNLHKMLYRFLEPTLKFTAMIGAIAGIAIFFIKKEKEGEFHLAKEKMDHERQKHKTELAFKHIEKLSPEQLKAFLEKMTEPPPQLT